MRSQSDPCTLFHLVPDDEYTFMALCDPNNEQFVSPSRNGQLGLEVGCHVPSVPCPPLITTLGRDADLTLRITDFRNRMSRIHVAFKFNPGSKHVVLSVQSEATSSVSYAAIPKTADKKKQEETASVQEQGSKGVHVGKTFIGGGVICYEHDYEIRITSYRFRLLWLYDSVESGDRALRGHQKSLKRLSQYDPMDCDTTRLSTVGKLDFEEIEDLREDIGSGAFGTVSRRVDRRTGDVFAVKQANLENPQTAEWLFRVFRMEIAIMQDLNHPNIIPFLGDQHLDTDRPKYFMPAREGKLSDLALGTEAAGIRSFSNSVLKQMLSALDYTASKGVIHRDLKPDNILYYRLPDHLPSKDKFCFQLADFGLAQYTAVAKSFDVGTPLYMAPELCPEKSKVKARQSPKIDIWSLFATMVAINPQFVDFPPQSKDYAVILNALRAEGVKDSCGPMGRLNPRRRPSAAQMLKYFFNGEGLTTPLSDISEIEPADEADEADEAAEADKADKNNETDKMGPSSTPVPSNPQQTEDDDGSTLRQPNVTALESGSASHTGNNSGSTVQQLSAASSPQRIEDHQTSTQSRSPLSSAAPTILNRRNRQPQPKPGRKRGAGVAKRTAKPRAARARTQPRRAHRLPDLEIPSGGTFSTPRAFVNRR
ncbi:kinase-like protein [Nemania abortiva]|nr:kinase-like protein [Nemania abortiva]